MGSFRKRLLVLIIGLLVVTQTVTLAAVLASTAHTVEGRAAEELRSGGSFAQQLIRFRAGQLAMIKVHVGRGAYGQRPVANASVTVKILGTTFRPMIQTTDTDGRGIAVVRATLPRFTSGRAAIIIRAAVGDDAIEMRRIIHQ